MAPFNRATVTVLVTDICRAERDGGPLFGWVTDESAEVQVRLSEPLAGPQPAPGREHQPNALARKGIIAADREFVEPASTCPDRPERRLIAFDDAVRFQYPLLPPLALHANSLWYPTAGLPDRETQVTRIAAGLLAVAREARRMP